MAVASLPMYDLPAIASATDEWWRGLARAFALHGIADVPQAISRGPAVRDLWADRNLLFSQTCGYPLINELRQHVQLIATPCFAAPGCNATDYCSIIVVPADAGTASLEELKGGTCAINRRDSHSGCNVLRGMIAPLAEGRPFFDRVKISGHHWESLQMVARGEADVAAIDCVTYALIARHEPHTVSKTRALCCSPPAPGLPYVTSRSVPEERVTKLRDALASAFHDPSLAQCRETLMLTEFRVLPLSDYDRIAAIEAEAMALNYRELE
jgi:ABC-type phosphate/phosphonate transport system substrate-binding protein